LLPIAALAWSLALGAALEDDARFSDALALYRALELEQAIVRLQEVALDEQLTPAERGRVFVWIGVSCGQVGDLDKARRAFERAVAADPAAALEVDVSPKVRELLDAARAEAPPRVVEPSVAPATPPEPSERPDDKGPAVERPTPSPADGAATVTTATTATTATAGAARAERDEEAPAPWLWVGLSAGGGTVTLLVGVAAGALGVTAYAVAAAPTTDQIAADQSVRAANALLYSAAGLGLAGVALLGTSAYLALADGA